MQISREYVASPRTSHLYYFQHGEPLTRRDLQFDVLSHIFNDEHAVFTDPIHPGCKLSFSQLYINAILSSTKTTKVMYANYAANGRITYCLP